MATCKVCSFQYADTEPRCPRCGFGASTSMAAPPTASPPVTASSGSVESGPAQPAAFVNLLPGVSVGPSGVSVAAPRRRGILILVVLILLALPIAGIFLAGAAINKVTDVVIPGVQELFEPGPGNTETSGTSSISPAQCEEILSRYLKKMFFAMDRNPDKISALFIEASERLGPSSREYRDLVEIFSTQELSALAAEGHPAKAFKRAKPLIQKKCKG